ncbi:MAG: class IV adenylate cyclase, partial [Candidatus Acidiferrales bacterium]
MQTRRAGSGSEIETKLRVTDRSALRARLEELHAVRICPRTYESNTLFDTPAEDLRRLGRMIRIRVEQPASKAKRRGGPLDSPALLTYKGPPRKSHISSKEAGEGRAGKRLKIREELEVTLDSWRQMTNILHATGLRPAFRYEKFRTTYTLPGIRGLKVELDETPLGCFLELEGGARAIDRAARLLGYKRGNYITETYG